MNIYPRRLLFGALMLLMLNSACNMAGQASPTLVGTILPEEPAFTAGVPTHNQDAETATPSIPNTGAGTQQAVVTPTAVVTLPTPSLTPTSIFPVPPTATSRLSDSSATPTSIFPVPPTATTVPPLQPTSLTPATRQPRSSGLREPDEFIRWYFEAVWRQRNYQDLWDNYQTASFKNRPGSGSYEDYVEWWNSVERVDVNSVEVIQNDGTQAWVRVNITFNMQDGRLVSGQVYDYELLYDPGRRTWMFDYRT